MVFGSKKKELQKRIDELEKEISSYKSKAERSIRASDLAVQLDEKGNVEYINTAMCKVLGISKEKCRTIDDINYPGININSLLEEASKSGDMQKEINIYDLHNKAEKWYNCKVFFSGGKPTITLQDITHEKLNSFYKPFVGKDTIALMKECLDDKYRSTKLSDISVLFCDLRGFTAVSEKLFEKPEELENMINEYYRIMTDVIQNQNNGTLDKYIGDAIMALFGAPVENKDHALVSAKTALQMKDAHKEFSDKWAGKGHELPLGIAIDSGESIVGLFGTSDRKQYTAFGPPVNTASRLCYIAKGNEILISKNVHDILSNGSYDYFLNKVEMEKKEPVKLKNVSAPVEYFNIKLK